MSGAIFNALKYQESYENAPCSDEFIPRSDEFTRHATDKFVSTWHFLEESFMSQ